MAEATTAFQTSSFKFVERSANETPRERKVRAFACRCVLLVKMNDLNPKITSLQNKWRTIVARSVLSDKQDGLQEKKAARKAAKKIRHVTLKIRKRIASRTLQVFANTIRGHLQNGVAEGVLKKMKPQYLFKVEVGVCLLETHLFTITKRLLKALKGPLKGQRRLLQRQVVIQNQNTEEGKRKKQKHLLQKHLDL